MTDKDLLWMSDIKSGVMPDVLALSKDFPASYQRLVLFDSHEHVACVLRSPEGILHIFYAMKDAVNHRWNAVMHYKDEFINEEGVALEEPQAALGEYRPDLVPRSKVEKLVPSGSSTYVKSVGFTSREGPGKWPKGAAAIRLSFLVLSTDQRDPGRKVWNTQFTLLLHKTLLTEGK